MHPFPAAMMMQGVGGGVAAQKPQDVHSTMIYTGNNTTRDLALGFRPDVASFKSRSNDGGIGHARLTSLNNFNTALRSNTPDAPGTGYSAFLSSTATGVRIVNDGAGELNNTNNSKVLWADKQAPKYLQIRTFTHNSGTADTFDMSVLGVVGEVTIKRTDAAGDWYFWHRSLDAGNNLRLNTPAAQSPTDAFVSVSGTTVTFATDAPSGTYYLEAWAHDPDTVNGIIQCGVHSGGATVNLGWRPQYMTRKCINEANSWYVFDTARGWGSGADKYLVLNSPAAESSEDFNTPTATGFTDVIDAGGPQYNFIYRVIRAAY